MMNGKITGCPSRLLQQNQNNGRIGFRRTKVRPKRGFTLLMSVVALAIGVLVLASIARLSQSKAMLARQQLQQLQWRWGNYSCQQVLLKNADKLLKSDAGSRQVNAEIELRYQLGQQNVFVRIADENQKLDINTLSQRVPQSKLEQIVADFNTSNLPVRLRPLPDTDRRNLKEGGLECWDQVWQLPAEPDIQQLIIGSRQLTLWANRLNVFSSSEEKIRQFGQPFVGAIVVEKLIAARSNQDANSLDSILEDADLNQRQAEQCRRLFCDQSTSYSMWLTMVHGKRMQSSLTIREGIPVSGSQQVVQRVHAFRW